MTTGIKLPNGIRKFVEEFRSDLEATVKAIEASPGTTMYHYGDYLACLTKLCHGKRHLARLLAIGLVECGGDKRGIAHALTIMGAMEGDNDELN
jgi:hypothetical protein